MTKPHPAELAGLRQKIDATDDQIIALLRERTELVKQVGAAKDKSAPGQCIIRSGREADMVRRVMEKCAEFGFPPAAAAGMWRLLISASIAVEGPIKISVFSTNADRELYWMAREYFGAFTPITSQPHVKRVIGDVMDGTASVGIIPTIQSDDTSNWWANLMQPGDNTPKIFAHIPFVSDQPGNQPTGLAIARITPEPSSDDLSLLVLETDHNVSQHRLQQAFAKANIDARWINIAMLMPNARHHLVELKGFITETHEGFQAFTRDLDKSLVKTTYLGSYGVPINLQPKAAAPHVQSAKA